MFSNLTFAFVLMSHLRYLKLEFLTQFPVSNDEKMCLFDNPNPAE